MFEIINSLSLLFTNINLGSNVITFVISVYLLLQLFNSNFAPRYVWTNLLESSSSATITSMNGSPRVDIEIGNYDIFWGADEWDNYNIFPHSCPIKIIFLSIKSPELIGFYPAIGSKRFFFSLA